MLLKVNETTHLKGSVTPPSSKSESIRAIFIAALSENESILENVLHSDDTEDALQVCQKLGAVITVSHNRLTIKGTPIPLPILENEINSGNSGLTTHFLMPLLGLRKNPKPIILHCGQQMRARPIEPLVLSLRNLGLTISYLGKSHTLPISISGELLGGKTEVDGTTSQYLSALLLTLPLAKLDSEITVKNLRERSYADMTLEYLNSQAIQFNHIQNQNLDIFNIQGRQQYKKMKKTISVDFSSASYLIAAAALISGEVIIKGINLENIQGDKALITILKKMGADIEIQPNQLTIRGGKKLEGISIDANDIPDLLPILAVLGTYARGQTNIFNVAHARIKETDRIHSLSKGLSSMGAKVIEKQDGLIIYKSSLKGALVKGYGDHRTVMALSVAGLIAVGTTYVSDPEAIEKTFPTFINSMQLIGAKMETTNDISS